MGVPAKKDQFQFHVDRKEMGRADSFRYNVISFVVEEQYDRAVSELRNFIERDSEYPNFREKTERYVGHAIDLVNAIKAKRSFPGSKYMTMAKQQELNDRFREHFGELQQVLKRVEKIHVDLRMDDVRSTVWVLKALVLAVGAIVTTAFLLEVFGGLYMTSYIVVDDAFSRAVNWVFEMGGW